jgi:hypothetical protein
MNSGERIVTSKLDGLCIYHWRVGLWESTIDKNKLK